MKFIKGTLAIALTSVITACGGGGSKGYYNQGNSGGNNTEQPPITSPELEAAATTLASLKKEGKFLFGNYDASDSSISKGYIDHALDTFAQGPLQLTVDAKKLFDQDKSHFTYYETCFGGEGNRIYENTPCYALEGEENIKTALNIITPNKYNDWDFKITKEQLNSLKITPEQIKKFTGETFILIFDNQNADKAWNDIWIAGVFGYPYQQS